MSIWTGKELLWLKAVNYLGRWGSQKEQQIQNGFVRLHLLMFEHKTKQKCNSKRCLKCLKNGPSWP
jgi:hypothetical protein